MDGNELLTSQFRAQLIRTVLHEAGALVRVRRFIGAELFAEGIEQQVVGFILEHFDRYGRPPSLFAFEEECERVGVDEAVRAEMVELVEPTPEEPEYTCDRVVEFVQARNASESGLQLVEDLESGTAYAEAIASFRDRIQEFEETAGREIVLPRDLKLDLEQVIRLRVPTGFEVIDNDLDGGLPVGHLGVVVAPPNHGKSTCLIHLGIQALKARLTVFHVSVEMSAAEITKRYRRSGALRGARRANAPPRLIVTSFEATDYTADNLRHDLDRMIAEHKARPDLLIVDYAGEMSPRKRYREKRDELRAIFSDLRGVALSYDAALWTGAQANRENVEKRKRVRVNHTADSYGIVQVADVMLTISRQGEDPADNRELEILLDKNRLGPVGASSLVIADYARGVFAEEDEEPSHGLQRF